MSVGRVIRRCAVLASIVAAIMALHLMIPPLPEAPKKVGPDTSVASIAHLYRPTDWRSTIAVVDKEGRTYDVAMLGPWTQPADWHG